MNRHLCKAARKLAIVMVCALVILGLSACSKDTTSGYLPDEGASWGDLCRHFDSEWYDSLQEEVKAQCDELILGEDVSTQQDNPSISSSMPIYNETEDTQDSGYTVFASDAGELTSEEAEIALTDIILMINEQDKALDYVVSAFSSLEEVPADMVIILALSDTTTGEYLAVDTKDFSVTKDVGGMEGSFSNLKQDNKYTAQVLAIVVPPEGYTSSGPLYVEQEATATEPANISE